MRPAPLSIGIALVLAVIAVAGFIALRPPPDRATPSPPPAPTAPATTTASAASPGSLPTATTSPTASPSPAAVPSPPQRQYVSKRLGMALTLPAPWRNAGCGNSDPRREQLPIIEQFTSAPVMEEHIGHAGQANDRIDVRLDANPSGSTPAQFAQSRFREAAIRAVTLAGRPAVEVRTRQFGPGEAIVYVFAEGDRMYSVSALPRTSAPPDIETMLGILRSFRLLSDAERRALPDPTPIPAAASSAEALASMLKAAFERKDIAALERVLGPCISQGVVPGGGASEPRERFIVELRRQLDAGVVVTVDASVVLTDDRGPRYRYVWSKWNAFPPGGGAPPQTPGPETYNVQLIFAETSAGFYWSGTLLVHTR